MKKSEVIFISVVNDFYKNHGRHTLPWRKTSNPYRIMVSEIMLQQTQVERVIPKYHAFLRQFPTVRVLAAAPLGEVLSVWQGLGYNRRAKLLQQAAVAVVNEHAGRFPKTYEELLSLPGVGPYTAGAISAFAYNTGHVLIETNIRTVYLHHFYRDERDVPDSKLLPIIEHTLDRDNPRAWYAALMDYGSFLKASIGNVSRQSKHHTVQKPFKGSDREIRGAIIRALSNNTSLTEVGLLQTLVKFDPKRVEMQAAKLLKEEMIVKSRGRYKLPT